MTRWSSRSTTVKPFVHHFRGRYSSSPSPRRIERPAVGRTNSRGSIGPEILPAGCSCAGRRLEEACSLGAAPRLPEGETGTSHGRQLGSLRQPSRSADNAPCAWTDALSQDDYVHMATRLKSSTALLGAAISRFDNATLARRSRTSIHESSRSVWGDCSQTGSIPVRLRVERSGSPRDATSPPRPIGPTIPTHPTQGNTDPARSSDSQRRGPVVDSSGSRPTK
jgi:hypothetical protein